MDVMNEGIDLGGMSIAIAPSGMYIYLYMCKMCMLYTATASRCSSLSSHMHNRRTLYLRLQKLKLAVHV